MLGSAAFQAGFGRAPKFERGIQEFLSLAEAIERAAA